MKKVLSIMMSLILGAGFASGCGKSPDPSTPEFPQEEFADPSEYAAGLTDSNEVSQGQTYFASSALKGYEANEAFDSGNGRWSSSQSDKTGWLAVEFQQTTTVTAFYLKEYQKDNYSCITAYEAQVKDGNDEWSTVLTVNAPCSNGAVIRLNQPVATTCFRVKVIENTGIAGASFERMIVYGVSDEPDRYKLDTYFDLPMIGKGISGEYLYLAGGYNSVDRGAPEWGTSDLSQSLMIGDKAGEIVVHYKDGKVQVVPLIFGYTMWFKKHWGLAKMPFQGLNATDENKQLFAKTMHAYGADAGQEVPFLKIKMRNSPVCNIEVVDNAAKAGQPVFYGGYLASKEELMLSGKHSVNTKNKFFRSHTINIGNSLPKATAENIVNMALATMTSENDFANAPKYTYPANFKGAKVKFGGDYLADIMTGVYAENMMDMNSKIRDNGMVDESTENAPQWEYDGIGTYSENRGQYYGSMYSRNGKAVLSQSYTGFLDQVLKVVDYTNKQLMYHRENKLKMKGKDIPGHWGVMISNPLVYSKQLVPGGWPTRYVKANFGDDYQNMGNIEPDGHGLTMMAIYNIWRTAGSSSQWIKDNWKYIYEAADFLVWCMNNPDVSFSENNLIYGESEGGMMEFTMYNNIPCYIGLKMYAEMARAAGETATAETWEDAIGKMEAGINKVFKSGNKWDLSKFGFFHDPFVSQYADYTGYDINDMPAEWVELTENTYESDLNSYIKDSFIGPRGIGYDHNLIAQTALLLDKTSDAEQFVRNLAKISYSPRLPKPYIVPEGLTYDSSRGLYRRQGDLGNLAHQAESVKTILMTTGLSQYHDGVLKIMPRLPKSWDVDVDGINIPGEGGKIDFATAYPKDGVQTFTFTLSETSVNHIKFRAGAFGKEITKASAVLNGKAVNSTIEESGDSKWVWVDLSGLSVGQKYIVEVSVGI